MDNTYYPPQTTPQVNPIIAKAAAKGKFLDFRDGLNLATPQDYAMIHGLGGGKHAAKSTIRMVLTDYNAGKGNSTTVSANVTPELIPYILSICEKNAVVPATGQSAVSPLESALQQMMRGSVVSPPGTPEFVAIPLNDFQGLSQLSGFSSALQALYGELQQAAQMLPPDANTGMQYLALPRMGLQKLLDESRPRQETASVPVGGYNFTYRQERVNVYKSNNGFVPVKILALTREGLRKNGEVSRLPWTVKITNFEARPIPQKNGTTAYNSSTKQNIKEGFIQLSDFDMYRCLYRVNRYIELWEVCYGTGLIAAGINMKVAQRQAAVTGQPYPQG